MTEANPDSPMLPPSLQPTVGSFVAQLPVYEGPLDVLLRLIEERELEITRVSLAAVTGQFIAYIAGIEKREPQLIANFLQIAAKLIVLKSRVLLPQVTVVKEDEEETDDLVAALQAYQSFKRTARFLQDREKRGLRSYPIESPAVQRPKSTGLPLDNVSLAMLARAMQRVIDRWMPPPPVDDVMSRMPFTVNDCMDRIRHSVRAKERVRFDEMLVGVNTRVEIVITLLALLEMLKRYVVRAHQERPFGPIWFEHFPEAERPWAELGQMPPADDTVEFAV